MSNLRQRGQRRLSALDSLRDLDAYAKPLDDFQVKTLTGGTVTLISTLFIIFLIFSEFIDWNTVSMVPSLQVDSGRKEQMAISINVSFPQMPCFLLSLDVMDVSGDHQNDVKHQVFKQRLDSKGTPIHDIVKSSVGEKTTKENVEKNKNSTLTAASSASNNTCGDCYGGNPPAGSTCCQTCDDVKNAYSSKGWTINDYGKIAQCVKEGFAQEIESQMTEGCNMHGTLHVNKVAGNIHFAPGKSFNQGNMHVHDLHEYMRGESKYTWSHEIHQLSFGSNIAKNPLDGAKKVGTQGWSNYQYYVKVVRTDFHYRNSTFISTNQFSVTEHEKITPPVMGNPVAMPGLFITMEISPMLIKYTEYKKPFSHFLVDMCAIIGGVYTVAGLLDGLIYSAEKKFKVKLEIGKGS